MNARQMMTFALCLAAISAFAAPGAHGPNGEHLDAQQQPRASGPTRMADGSVFVPMLAQRRMAIRTVVSVSSDAQASVELPARVVIDPNAGGRVQATQSGRIEPGPRGLPFAGQSVREGEVLAWVRFQGDPYAAANQRAQLAELGSNRMLAQQRVERLQGLEGTVPRKEIEAARAELQSLTARERSIGASIGAREALLAPVSGVIASATALAGQVVEARETLFEVVDPTRYLVEATTSDAALPQKIGGGSLQGIDQAQLQYMGASVSLRDGVLPLTFRVRPVAGNASLPLAIGQTVTVIAKLSEKRPGFVLPASAVVRNGSNERVVWIKSGAERYVPQPVGISPLDSANVIVVQGLGADNRVVVQGAALLSQIR